MAARGIRLWMALTTPPVALPPYSSTAGPRSTSSRSMTSGSMATAWSKLRLLASKEAPPLSSMRTRSPSRPRITGRLAFGPKPVAETPGRPSSVSPSVAARRSARPLPDSTDAGCKVRSLPNGLPVITTVESGAVCAMAAWASSSTGTAVRGRQHEGWRCRKNRLLVMVSSRQLGVCRRRRPEARVDG